MGHADEVTTNVHTKRIVASQEEDVVSIAWDYPGSTLLEVRILRSASGFARDPEPDAEQVLVYQDVTGSFRDDTPAELPRYYTVFARQPGQEWHRWGEFPQQREAAVGGMHACIRSLTRGRRDRLFFCLAALICLAGLAAALPARAAAASTSTKGLRLTVAEQQALDAAAADPRVATVLADAGDPPAPRIVPWPAQRGSTVYYEWPAATATSVAEVWPLVKTAGSDHVPVPPYTQYERRLRVSDLTGLRVDVRSGGQVIQIMPMDALTSFDLHEQTWVPFSWLPWFTATPWVLVPLFALIGAVVIWRAWLRSRPWNRQLPSMTRHDRQFIGRFTVIIFLLAGFAWLVYEGIIAATSPQADPSAVTAGDLTTLPLLLIPPGLLLAALVLELSWQPHRVAWGLLTVLACAGSAYYLASAIIGTANNLNLSSYILLAVLALVAIPRAFSTSKMGWSRSFAPRYG